MPVKKPYQNSKRREMLSELFSEMTSIDDASDTGDYVRDVVAEMNSTPKEEIDKQIENTKEETELKKLVPGETLIGVRTGTVQGELRQISIFFGNFVNPMNIHNGRYVPLKKKEYLKILNEFLDSEEGRQYQKPTEEEINSAFAEVKESASRFIENQNRRQNGMMQPGRTRTAALSGREEPTQEEKGGQPGDDPEVQTFADDLNEEERKEVELIQAKQYTKQQMKEIRKTFDFERRISSAGLAALITIGMVILIGIFFVIEAVIPGLRANLEFELSQDEITMKAGDQFIPQNYVKYVTEDESIYIIYPNLDTSVAGQYKLQYVATNNFKNVKRYLVVNVLDDIGPSIILTDEEILLVRGRDEDSYDPMKYVKAVEDNVDEDLQPEVSELDWDKDEQILIYSVTDTSGNEATAELPVRIEDMTICDKNAYYISKTNTCNCKAGYSGSGTACKLTPTTSSVSTGNSSGNSDGNRSSENSSGNSSGNNSNSDGTSWSESYTFDYEDYQPDNGDYDVHITDNNTGESTTVTYEPSDPPPMPGSDDGDFWAIVENLP